MERLIEITPQPPPECSIHYFIGDESWLPSGERSPLIHNWEAWWGPLYHNRLKGCLCGSLDAKSPVPSRDNVAVEKRDGIWWWVIND